MGNIGGTWRCVSWWKACVIHPKLHFLELLENTTDTKSGVKGSTWIWDGSDWSTIKGSGAIKFFFLFHELNKAVKALHSKRRKPCKAIPAIKNNQRLCVIAHTASIAQSIYQRLIRVEKAVGHDVLQQLLICADTQWDNKSGWRMRLWQHWQLCLWQKATCVRIYYKWVSIRIPFQKWKLARFLQLDHEIEARATSFNCYLVKSKRWRTNPF